MRVAIAIPSFGRDSRLCSLLEKLQYFDVDVYVLHQSATKLTTAFASNIKVSTVPVFELGTPIGVIRKQSLQLVNPESYDYIIAMDDDVEFKYSQTVNVYLEAIREANKNNVDVIGFTQRGDANLSPLTRIWPASEIGIGFKSTHFNLLVNDQLDEFSVGEDVFFFIKALAAKLQVRRTCLANVVDIGFSKAGSSGGMTQAVSNEISDEVTVLNKYERLVQTNPKYVQALLFELFSLKSAFSLGRNMSPTCQEVLNTKCFIDENNFLKIRDRVIDTAAFEQLPQYQLVNKHYEHVLASSFTYRD